MYYTPPSSLQLSFASRVCLLHKSRPLPPPQPVLVFASQINYNYRYYNTTTIIKYNNNIMFY